MLIFPQFWNNFGCPIEVVVAIPVVAQTYKKTLQLPTLEIPKDCIACLQHQRIKGELGEEQIICLYESS